MKEEWNKILSKEDIHQVNRLATRMIDRKAWENARAQLLEIACIRKTGGQRIDLDEQVDVFLVIYDRKDGLKCHLQSLVKKMA